MFNPLKNPSVIRLVLTKAQEELNESLRYRKRQFQNPNLYLWVEIDSRENIPYISLRNEQDETMVRMTAQELLQDEAIQQQMKKIPAIVRPFINFKKIIPEMSDRLIKELGQTKNLKVMEGESIAYIELWERGLCVKKGVELYEIFG